MRILKGQSCLDLQQSDCHEPTYKRVCLFTAVGAMFAILMCLEYLNYARADPYMHEMKIPSQSQEQPSVALKSPGNLSKYTPLRNIMLSKQMIGRTGNQLFQWASVAGIARKNGVQYCTKNLELGKYFDAPFPKACARTSAYVVRERGFGIYEDVRITKDTLLAGYYQSFKYFQDLNIRNEIRFKAAYQINARRLLSGLNTSDVNTIVGVHVRRGDYVEKPYLRHLRFPTNDYFEKALNYYRQKYVRVKFVVVSNDIAWVRAQQVFNKGDVNATTTGNPIMDMAILANCDHGVISIGSFGWWSNYLAGGECVYFQKEFVLTHPKIKGKLRVEDYYLPHWKAI